MLESLVSQRINRFVLCQNSNSLMAETYLKLLKVTKTEDNEYVWHAAVRFGDTWYICEYTKNRLNQTTLNGICKNRGEKKSGKKCTAMITLVLGDAILPFVKRSNPESKTPYYVFDGGETEMFPVI